ncbi:MAG: DNA-binding response regulator [Methylobacter sp.]|nr:MAG: DNA-binding response regulator [Methylobacter sp.]
MNILLIEDDAVLADGLLHTLGSSGYTVSCATTALAAEQLVESQDFDLIVMDLGLPDLDGLQLLRRFRHRKVTLPIIILTARDGVNDRIGGIEQGADDYLTKPFELRELEARIQALIRRCYGGFDSHIRVGRLVLDTHQQAILADKQPFILPAREFGVLEILMMQAGKVVTKDRIAQRLSYDGEGISDNAIEISIHRLRKHLEPYGVVIRTVRGLGYLLESVNA